MPKREIKRYTKPDPARAAVEQEIRAIFNSFHACALSRKDAATLGLAAGRLCDNCEDSVRAHADSLVARLHTSEPWFLVQS